MRLDVLLIVGLWLALSAPAEATDCAEAATQLDLDRCAAQDFAKADALLNGTYKRVMLRLKENLQIHQLLTAAQKAWLTFRDTECDFVTSTSAGGIIHPMVVATCRARLTTDRAKMLQAYLDCPEGNLDCPLPPP